MQSCFSHHWTRASCNISTRTLWNSAIWEKHTHVNTYSTWTSKNSMLHTNSILSLMFYLLFSHSTNEIKLCFCCFPHLLHLTHTESMSSSLNIGLHQGEYTDYNLSCLLVYPLLTHISRTLLTPAGHKNVCPPDLFLKYSQQPSLQVWPSLHSSWQSLTPLVYRFSWTAFPAMNKIIRLHAGILITGFCVIFAIQGQDSW